MLDHLRLMIPFDASLVVTDSEGRMGLVAVDLHELEIPLAARAVEKYEDGSVHATALYHPYESLPTSFTAMAMKVHLDSSQWPCVELKASPAKIMQGHNVFGTDDIETGALEMLGFLAEAYPSMYGMLWIQGTEVHHLDITYSARLKDEQQVKLVIDYFSRVSNGQTRSSKKQFDGSCYWGGETSRLINHKAYAKYAEFMAQLDEYRKRASKNDAHAKRVLDVMQDSRLIDWTQGLLRWESRLKHRYLQRRGIPTNLFELIKHQRANPDLLQTLWLDATKSIFEALRGQTMKATDHDSVYKRLCATYQTVTPRGKVSLTKARNLFNFYCALEIHGAKTMKEQYSERQYYQLLSDLVAAGFSKAFLQNLHTDNKSNVIPLLKFTEVDFSAQLPSWYQPPVSSFNYAA